MPAAPRVKASIAATPPLLLLWGLFFWGALLGAGVTSRSGMLRMVASSVPRLTSVQTKRRWREMGWNQGIEDMQPAHRESAAAMLQVSEYALMKRVKHKPRTGSAAIKIRSVCGPGSGIAAGKSRSFAPLRMTSLSDDDQPAPPPISASAGHDGVSYLCRLEGNPHVVGPNDVRALQDQSRFCSQSAIEALGNLGVLAIAGQHAPDKRFS